MQSLQHYCKETKTHQAEKKKEKKIKMKNEYWKTVGLCWLSSALKRIVFAK